MHVIMRFQLTWKCLLLLTISVNEILLFASTGCISEKAEPVVPTIKFSWTHNPLGNITEQTIESINKYNLETIMLFNKTELSENLNML